MSAASIPMPPLELRQLVGPTDPSAFDNPSGQPIFGKFGLSLEAYDSVFDFGSGCGRVARQLLQQNPRPRRYVGIDVHREMVEWCQQNLSPIDPNFQFFHHDVYAPSYAPRNSLQLAQPFPVQDGETTLFVASSVFTHLFKSQTEYYLRELVRILKPGGVAYTTWFLFDNDSFPFLHEGPFCLYASEVDPTQAVIYDRRWLIETVRHVGLGVSSTIHPGVAGHQWVVMLVRRDLNTVDQFPIGEEGAEWLCGATHKTIATPAYGPEAIKKGKVTNMDAQVGSCWPQPPALFGTFAELAAARRELEAMKRT